MKWDSVDVFGPIPDPSPEAMVLSEELGLDLSKPIVVAGSTAEGEEALLHRVCPPGAQLVCAPRKVDRFDDAAAAMPGCTRRSTGEPESNTRFVLDTIGELSTLYEIADVVVIGRSFFGLYGSDPLEPVALGKPVLIGPAYSDFENQVEVLLVEDGIEVVDRDGLGDRIHALLQDPARRAQLGDHARQCVGRHQGASRAHADLLLNLIR